MKLHDDIDGRIGDDVVIIFTVRDRNGNLVSLTGATATYKLAPKGSYNAVLELEDGDGITLSGSTASIEFNLEDLDEDGNYLGQLRITKDGKSMVSAEGLLIVSPLIQ